MTYASTPVPPDPWDPLGGADDPFGLAPDPKVTPQTPENEVPEGVHEDERIKMLAAEGKQSLLVELQEVLDRHRVYDEGDRKAFLDSLSLPRRLYWLDRIGTSAQQTKDWPVDVQDSVNANLISSEIAEKNGIHAPALDLDFPCTLVPSTTPGHYHLYLDKAMTWDEYVMMLRILAVVGILEEGYVKAAIKRKKTLLRAPWVKKDPKDLVPDGDDP